MFINLHASFSQEKQGLFLSRYISTRQEPVVNDINTFFQSNYEQILDFFYSRRKLSTGSVVYIRAAYFKKS